MFFLSFWGSLQLEEGVRPLLHKIIAIKAKHIAAKHQIRTRIRYLATVRFRYWVVGTPTLAWHRIVNQSNENQHYHNREPKVVPK
ncbi:MAG: hypothetical protein PHC69_02850 [Ruminiclostridium sp.]|nr:hypothetical protein [Ruminiclostridium sp.]